MDITLDYQSKDCKIDPRFSSLSDETLNRGPSPYDLFVGGMLNMSSLTHYFYLLYSLSLSLSELAYD